MSDVKALLEVMARLRDPETGCPWDREQTLASIVPHTLEEAYEVADAIARSDMGDLRDELGDLLFQVVFYARLAEERGDFAFADVVQAICDKLIRRHPHVFSGADITDAEAQTAAWEAHKARERRDRHGEGALAGVALALPALSRAAKLTKRAARVGFDWPDLPPVFDKMQEELDELHHEVAQGSIDMDRVEDEMGDVLFVASNLARKIGVDPEVALRRANAKFERRFAAMEALAAAEGVSLDTLNLDRWESLWVRVKQGETTDSD
ncbi:Nucleoside triphosphate pyrophosphohydrolase MazG [hydrothermal vent metagenome]|uniref:Nucleoside triphosphate pyrophosphohydrolase MazG n=1 Tax=hydrothermal vent metagenome TaxID=652676 RepID=A0A3B1AXE4_9ZZZZ